MTNGDPIMGKNGTRGSVGLTPSLSQEVGPPGERIQGQGGATSGEAANTPWEGTGATGNDHITTAPLKEKLRENRTFLVEMLSEKLIAILQLLQADHVITSTEADQIRKKQRRHQRAASLIDIVSRKDEQILAAFMEALSRECPQAYDKLASPNDKVRTGSAFREVDITEITQNIGRCLKNPHHGPYNFYHALKSALERGIDIKTVVFENGHNILHEIVRLDCPKLLKYISYSGIWNDLYNLPNQQPSTGSQTGLTPLELATTLKRIKVREAMSELNKFEILLREVHRCVRSGNIGRFRQLRDSYIKHVRSKKSLDDESLLEFACQSREITMVNEIIMVEKELPFKRVSIEKVLALCVDVGYHHLLLPLLEYMPLNINHVIVEGKTLVEHAAANGDFQTLQELEKLGAVPRETVLALAAAQNRLPFLQNFLSHYPRKQHFLNFQDKRGKTALHFAAEKGYSEVLKFLISNSHNLELRDKRGYSILHAAVSGGNLCTVEVVLDACSQLGCLSSMVNSRDRYLGADRCFLVRGRDQENPAWHYVEVERGVIDVFQKRTAGGSVDVAVYGRVLKSGWGINPTPEIVKEVEGTYDALNSAQDAPSDMQPLHVAIIKRHENIALKLISVMDDVSQPDRFGLTPLHLASMRGYLKVIRELLKKGIAVDVHDAKGRTPIDIAKLNDHQVAVTMLTESSRLDTTRIRQIIAEALNNLSDEMVDQHKPENQSHKFYVRSILRDVIADINEYMYESLGEGPIASESGTFR